MGDLDAGLVASRIRAASMRSQIIVETLGTRSGKYRTFFADTIFGRKYLQAKTQPENFLGVFHGRDGEMDFMEMTVFRYE